MMDVSRVDEGHRHEPGDRAGAIERAFRLGQRALDGAADVAKDRTASRTIGLVTACLDLARISGSVSPTFQRHLIVALGAEVQRAACARTARSTVGLTDGQLRRLEEILTANPSTGVADLARVSGYSPGHLARAMKATTGMTPNRWIIAKRVGRAKAQLLAGVHTLAEIALDCGFGDQSYFTRVFTREVGVSPGRYRDRVGHQGSIASSCRQRQATGEAAEAPPPVRD